MTANLPKKGELEIQQSKLTAVDNQYPHRDYEISVTLPEFTCLCPITGYPDFATIQVKYIPDGQVIELKSLKLYIWSYRDQGAFHEAVTNRILDDLARATRPRYMRLEARFNVRGGIFTTVVAEHRRRGWRPPPPLMLDSLPAANSRTTHGA